MPRASSASGRLVAGVGRLTAAAVCLALTVPGLAAAARKKPNILFVIMDDVGIDQMRTFGYAQDNQPRLPNIDAIAEGGVRFRNAWAMPECSPSRVSMFTGRYPLRTGVMTAFLDTDLANSQMSPYETTLPKVLARAGYRSALIGKYHMAGPYNYPSGNLAPRDAGFDYFYGNLEGAPRPIDTTAGGVAAEGTYTCGYVNDAGFGACRFADGTCSDLGSPLDLPSTHPGRTCLEQGGILVPATTCAGGGGPTPDFDAYNGYYVAPLVVIENGVLQDVPTTDPRARAYLTVDQTDAAIAWITQARASGKPWMATVSYSAAHLPVQQVPASIVPEQPPGTGALDCTTVPAARILQNHMTEGLDAEVGRLLTTLGLATRNPDGSLAYDPASSDTMIVVVGDNGTYGLSVKAPFDPSRAKGYAYQTGVWVPLVASGPLVHAKKVGSELGDMVNTVDLYRLFAEIAGVDVDKVVPKSHTVDARPMLPYLKKGKHNEIRKTNFTQIGQNIRAAGTVLWPCVIPSVNVCVQLFTTAGLCESEGGTWYGPDGAAGADGIATCCDVNAQLSQDYALFPIAQWALRDDQYKVVLTEETNCATSMIDLSYGFYAIDDAAPVPALDRAAANLLAQGLTAAQQKAYDTLSQKLDAMLASEPPCSGDGNLDRRVDQKDLNDWTTFLGVGSSVYDLDFDGQTDDADTLLIRANFGARCKVKKGPR
ncbi:MAG: sulfatase-like hydrolase/transferase [bacterium]|nr:sulfatase-like hydrolase/transferase [bacterium]